MNERQHHDAWGPVGDARPSPDNHSDTELDVDTDSRFGPIDDGDEAVTQWPDGDDSSNDAEPFDDGDGIPHGSAAHDAEVDADLDRLDDGGDAVGRHLPASGALPFVMSAREQFASVGDVAVTGDARVDAATARLEEVADLPTSDHLAVYDDVHRRLQDALSDADVR